MKEDMPRLGRQVDHFEKVDTDTIIANFSPCRRYRYTLLLSYRDRQDLPRKQVAVLLKNPSSADEQRADITIKRVETLIYHQIPDATRLCILNLFGLRATDPAEVSQLERQHGLPYIIGDENDCHIREQVRASKLVVCAWGGESGIGKPAYDERIDAVFGLLSEFEVPLWRLNGRGSARYPWHAQVWNYSKQLIEFRQPRLEELLLRTVPGLAQQWRGATVDEIKQFERIAGRPLPSFYHWFLTRMGQNMGPLAYPTLDFSARRVLECYAEGRVVPHPRFLLIGYDSREVMPLHVFYDLDAPAREDALVAEGVSPGDEMYDQFETFREMLAWRALLKFRVKTMPQQCEGVLSSDEPDLLSVLDPLMRSLGFTQPISTGPYCGLYERPDAVMICTRTPKEQLAGNQAFTLGGRDAEILRKLLGALATGSSLEVEVDEWTPALK